MTNPWEAEVSLSETQTKQLIEEQFPELSPVSTEQLGTGWDNTAWLVNGIYVFRFPRRQLGADCLEAEIAALPQIAGRLSVQISAPTMIGHSTDIYPWQFAGYRKLPGQDICETGLTELERNALAKPLGKFLRELHSITEEEAILMGAPRDTLGRIDVNRRESRTRKQIQQAVEQNFIDDVAPFESMITEALQVDVSQHSRSLVHGDLYEFHLLMDENKQLSGVIDWGDVHYGHIAVDLMIAFSLFRAEGRALFFETYGPIDEETIRLTRFRTLYHKLTLLFYAEETGLHRLKQAVLQGLSNLAESYE